MPALFAGPDFHAGRERPAHGSCSRPVTDQRSRPSAYAGIAPVAHRSGTSIRGEHPARSGKRKLKRALTVSAAAGLYDPAPHVQRPQTRREQEAERRPHLSR